MAAASRCCPEVPAPQPQPPRTSPDDLAAELNPHKTELNPHKAVEAASRARTDQTGLPSSGQSPPARQLAKAELSHRPRSAVPMTLRYRHGPSLRTRSRRSGRLAAPRGSRVEASRSGQSARPRRPLLHNSVGGTWNSRAVDRQLPWPAHGRGVVPPGLGDASDSAISPPAGRIYWPRPVRSATARCAWPPRDEREPRRSAPHRTG